MTGAPRLVPLADRAPVPVALWDALGLFAELIRHPAPLPDVLRDPATDRRYAFGAFDGERAHYFERRPAAAPRP